MEGVIFVGIVILAFVLSALVASSPRRPRGRRRTSSDNNKHRAK